MKVGKSKTSKFIDFSVAPFNSLKERKINETVNEIPGIYIIIFNFIGPGAYESN